MILLNEESAGGGDFSKELAKIGIINEFVPKVTFSIILCFMSQDFIQQRRQSTDPGVNNTCIRYCM